jgi:phosphatidylinositol alpha 1,6-mannosyltransferase
MSHRIAFFTDSLHEVNGVALTSREFVNFARRRSIPTFSVHAGPADRVIQEGSITTWEFRRGPVRWTMEHDLAIDLLFLRYRNRLLAALREFRPDLVHITGPGDAGILGALAAWELKVPLVASWHTNIHEFAARRLSRLLSLAPSGIRTRLSGWVERKSLDRCMWFYGLARLLFAPNPELVELLSERTGRPTHLMKRGIDTALFSPNSSARQDPIFTIGYVGRLSPEKNVRMLFDLQRSLEAAGLANYRFLVVGEGSERLALRSGLRRAELPGVLSGEKLRQAYASMDVFVFPSFTDTFGNVVLESMASGVVPVVASAGGPKFLVEHGVTGYIATQPQEFAAAILELYNDRPRRDAMGEAARRSAAQYSWDAVFERMHVNYNAYLSQARPSPIRSLAGSVANTVYTSERAESLNAAIPKMR